MSSSTQKAPSHNAPAGHDPHITPWQEEERAARRPTAPRRGVKDWIVLFLGILLGLYVITFLLLGTSESSFGGFASSGQVAIIPIYGTISTATDSGSTGYLDVIASLKQAQEDPYTKAILLDIDSPGGSVVSTKQIVSFIQTEVDKPVISWIGEVGASGAYYVAASTDYIVADSDSITGSIGVISEQINVEGLLEKLGIEVVDINAGKFKTIGSPYKQMTPEEQQILQDIVDQVYGHFKSDVISFRQEKGLDLEQFDQLSDGRIITGQRAFEAKMIDQIGTRRDAIRKAAALGGIDGEPETETIVQEHFSLSDLFFSAGKNFGLGFSAGMQPVKNETQGIDAK